MGETTVVPPIPEEQPGDSFPSRLLGIFISPVPTFESIVRRPDFLAPLIVSTVASIVFVEAMLERVGAARIIRHALENSSRARQMTPEQLDQAVHQGAAIAGITIRVF